MEARGQALLKGPTECRRPNWLGLGASLRQPPAMVVQYQEAVVLLADLVEDVATDTAQPKTMVEAIVRAALARIERAVGERETVNLVGFGRFEVYERSARRARNLRTGESLKIPATRAVRFRIGKRLRDAAAGSKSKRSGKGKK